MESAGTKKRLEWKAAIDPKSGRTYYYNIRTKETSWNKPLELASPEEQQEMLKKRAETLSFFREMEANIRCKIERARETVVATLTSTTRMDRTDQDSEFSRFRRGSIGGQTRLVRTISSMDDDIINMMKTSSRDIVDGNWSTICRSRDSIDDFRKLVGNDREEKGISPYLLGGVGGGITFKASDAPIDYSIADLSEFTSAPAKAEAKGVFDSKAADVKGYSVGGSVQSAATATYELPAPKRPNHGSEPTVTASGRGIASGPRGAGPAIALTPHGLKRRNSTGTIYIGTTMSTQDNEATIKCVCAVIRAHMVEAQRELFEPLSLYDVFKDAEFTRGKGRDEKASELGKVPSFKVVKEFFNLVFSKSQLESECIIIALIYCERLVKETKGRLCIRFDNWRSILFACLVMASKVWDDLSMWNVDFSQVCPSFDLQRINSLELAMLEALKYLIRVSASEYAKYYFHLRSMMARLGFHANEPSRLEPLDIAGARRLQLATEKYLADQDAEDPSKRRSSQPHGKAGGTGRGGRGAGAGGSAGAGRAGFIWRLHSVDELTDTRTHALVGLEQLVHTDHMDADGSAHRNVEIRRRLLETEFHDIPRYSTGATIPSSGSSGSMGTSVSGSSSRESVDSMRVDNQSGEGMEGRKDKPRRVREGGVGPGGTVVPSETSFILQGIEAFPPRDPYPSESKDSFK